MAPPALCPIRLFQMGDKEQCMHPFLEVASHSRQHGGRDSEQADDEGALPWWWLQCRLV